MTVLISDKLAKEGKDVLEENGIAFEEKIGLSPDELRAVIAEYDGIIVRSKTELTRDIIESASSLRIIGRAGTGVDNVDLEAATERGILVVNAPEGNTTSTAELTFSMLLGLSRKIPQACASVKGGRWEKQKFGGVEVSGKTLGIIGLGRIGSQVAQYALAFRMRVLVFDPYVSEESVEQLRVQSVDLDTLLSEADFITVHTPLKPETKGMLDEKAFRKMKDGVRIINCARGGIVDEQALYNALKQGKVAGAALDVFEHEPPGECGLLQLENVVTTPHLGASTAEAQISVAVQIAKRVAAFIKDGNMNGAVNLPPLDEATAKRLKPYLSLCEKLGSFSAQMMRGRIRNITLAYSGEPGASDTTPLTRGFLKGFLGRISEEPVNYVNAAMKAQQRGIKVIESKSAEAEDFAALIKVIVKTDQEDFSISGTIFGTRNDPRIVRINDYHVDAIPAGVLIIIHNWDKPGTIGRIGTVIGKHTVNIADMTLGRKKDEGKAVIVLNIDGEIDSATLNDLKELEGIIEVKVVYL